MLRKLSTYPAIDWNLLALALAGGLLYALMMLVIRPDLTQLGHGEVPGAGCHTLPRC